MKKYLIFFLFLLSMLTVANSHNIPQFRDKKIHVADIYNESDIIHLGDIPPYIFDEGELHNYIIYTFTIHNRSTLFMANMIGTDTDYTGLALYYRPLNSTGRFTRKHSSWDNHRAPEALEDQEKFGFDFEEDLTQADFHSPVLYETLEPGEYELYSIGTEDTKNPTRRLRTNIYLSPVGVDDYTALDIGHFEKDFSKKIKSGTFNGGDIYYKFSLDSMNMISIALLDTMGRRPVIKLETYYQLLITSNEYPLNEDSLPQIKDFKCGAGEYYIHIYYPDSAYRTPSLHITGLVDEAGADWEHPFEVGTYSDSLYYETFYFPAMFVPSESYIKPCVHHRFTIKKPMDISIITEDFLNSLTLYDSAHHIVRQVEKDDYMTSLDVFGLSPGTYTFVTEGGYNTMCVKAKGKRSVQELSDTKNYVSTAQSTIGTPFASDLQEPLSATHEIQYFDPFGRVEQTVQYGVTPALKSLVNRKEYDRMYRDSCAWLPAACSGSGNYVSSSDFEKYILELYNDKYACEKSVYDGSPLNRLVEKYNPGKDWHTTGHSEKISYRANSDVSQVRLFEVSGEKDNPILSQKGWYATGELRMVENRNEAGLPTSTYTNKLEQTILSRTISGTDTLDTYQVYDDFGNLVFVLPPMAVSSLHSLGQKDALELYAYQYRYDAYNHYKGKKLPGAEWIDMCFDQNGKLLRIRDGEMRNRNEWKCTFYDRFGREVATSIYKGMTPYNSDMYVDFAPDKLNNKYGYLFSSHLKMDSLKIQKMVYYDTYNYKMANSCFAKELDYVYNTSYGHRYDDDSGQLHCKNLQTGVMTRVVGTDQMLCTCTYYDFYHRPIQVRSMDINGKVNVENMSYDFSGNVVASNDQVGNISYSKNIVYDHAGRPLSETHLINDLVSGKLMYNYDELGRMTGIKRGNGSQSMTSTHHYNLRGWLTSIENPLFSQKLYYTNGIGIPYYNGNISSMSWKTGEDSNVRGYIFEYDPLSRLKNATYGEGEGLSLNAHRFDEQITGYDKHGNILGLKRYGETSAHAYGLVDNLAFLLSGNQLKSVHDSVSGSVFGDNFEFKDGSERAIEYFYDGNGNLIKDLNKKIADIEYNYLNLPSRIEFEDGSSISYLYDASGTKLRVVHTIAGNVTTTDYCGNVIYENGVPKILLTNAGFVSLTDNKYHYYLQDHQGNNRVVVSQDGTIEEVNHYYPFGGLFSSSSSVQAYKYNGKELDRKGGLDWYDYGARHYDAALGRWHAVDPMAEKYYGISPYAYCLSNPIKYVVPNGAFTSPYYTENGTFLGVDERGFTGNIYITNKDVFDKYSQSGIANSNQIQGDENTRLFKDEILTMAAESHIYTDVLKKSTDSKLDMSRLYNGEVSIVEKVYMKSNGTTFGKGYNDPAGHRKEPKYSTSIIGNQIKVTVRKQYNRYDLYTVESIQNYLGVHEYYGHGVKNWNQMETHWKCYNAQMNHSTFYKLPKEQQDEIRQRKNSYYTNRNH